MKQEICPFCHRNHKLQDCKIWNVPRTSPPRNLDMNNWQFRIKEVKMAKSRKPRKVYKGRDVILNPMQVARANVMPLDDHGQALIKIVRLPGNIEHLPR